MKVLIIGIVASGKTTLARRLSKETNIKNYEIDLIVHDDKNKRKRTNKEQTKNNIHDTQTFGVQDKTDNVLIGFAEFLDSLKESAFKTNKADNLLKIICLLWYN